VPEVRPCRGAASVGQTLPRQGRGELRGRPPRAPRVVTPRKGQSLSPRDHRPVVGNARSSPRC